MKTFYIALAVVALAGVAWIAVMSTGGPPPVITIDPGITAGTASEHVMGSPDAKVEIVEFGDFECPACGHFFLVTEPDIRKNLVETGKARFRFVHFPLPELHANAVSAHVAASCAAEQSQFWQMHDKLFEGQGEWSTYVTKDPRKVFMAYVNQLGLNAQAWEICYDEHKPIATILADVKSGEAIGVRGTPTFRIGSELLSAAAASSYDSFLGRVDSILADTARSK